jgi:uncharacterized membrane protein
MEYTFSSDIKASDLWKISMSRTYRSVAGVVNIVFTVAMLLMTVHFWNTANDFAQILLVIACLIFPVIQPLAVYGRSAKQVEDMPKGVKLLFNDAGLHITCGGENESLPWKKIKKVLKQRDMIVVMSDQTHGYMLMNRTLGDRKEEFYQYLLTKTDSEKAL